MQSRRRFLRAGAALVTLPAAAACNSLMGPSAPDRNWEVQERARFTFYVRPGSFAAANIGAIDEVLEAQYDGTQAMLEVQYTDHVSMFLYESGADAGLSSNFSGVAYPDTRSVRAVCAPPFDANRMTLLSHEFNHVITRNALGQAGTSFMSEGIATAVIVERFHQQGRHFLYPWTRSSRIIPPLASLLDDEEWERMPEEISYNTSASFLAWLIDSRGAGPLKQIFAARSSEFSARVQGVYGRPLEQLERDWRAFCDTWSG